MLEMPIHTVLAVRSVAVIAQDLDCTGSIKVHKVGRYPERSCIRGDGLPLAWSVLIQHLVISPKLISPLYATFPS